MTPDVPLPRNAATYVETVIARCESLIQSDIWSGLPITSLHAWLTNFATDQYRFLAARVLDSLIYRSHRQTDALITQLAHRSIPEALRRSGFEQMSDQWQSLMQGDEDPGIRILAVIGDDDPLSKSGPSVLRFFQKRLRVNPKWLVLPKRLDAVKKCIIYIDDFLGTGYQFKTFYRKTGLASMTEPKVIYAPLVAHQRGTKRLATAAPAVTVAPAEMIDDSYNLFSEKHAINKHLGISGTELKSIYGAFLKSCGLSILPRRVLGYGRLGLTFAFEHATPNASLPILWTTANDFVPLFQR